MWLYTVKADAPFTIERDVNGVFLSLLETARRGALFIGCRIALGLGRIIPAVSDLALFQIRQNNGAQR